MLERYEDALGLGGEVGVVKRKEDFERSVAEEKVTEMRVGQQRLLTGQAPDQITVRPRNQTPHRGDQETMGPHRQTEKHGG